MAVKDRKRRRLARLGVIRLGLLVDNASGKGQHPIQTDYFVLKDAPDIQAFYTAQGIEKVRELDVLLPFPDIERNFDAWYQLWAGGVLVCQGDGESVCYATPHTVKVDDKGRTRVYNAPGETLVANGEAQIDFEWNGHPFKLGDPVECPGESHDLYPHCAACKLSALLKVMMADPELFRMGYYQISTGSKRNHDTIMGTLELFPSDRVNSVPFKLRMVEEQVTYTENGQRKKGTKWFLQLEPDPKVTRLLYGQQMNVMLGQVVQPPRAALSAGPDWDDVEEPLPAPYVVDRVDASVGYGDDEEPPEEGFVLDESPDELSDSALPFPDGVGLSVRDSSFFEAVVDQIGFTDLGSAMGALRSITGRGIWRDADMLTYWHQLWDYKMAARAEAPDAE